MTRIGGVDLGATKAHVRAVDDCTGDVLLDDVESASGWATLSDEERANELARIVRERVVPLGVDRLVAGVHGVDTPVQRRQFADALAAVIDVSDVVNDAELILPATGARSGTGVIAGTGSCVTSRSSTGDAFTVGGWGWVLGDEGGATGIVRDAAKAALDIWDRGSADPLFDALLSAFGARHPHELGYLLSTVPPDDWARHAHVVFDQAANGSADARRVLAEQVDALVASLGVVRHRGGDLSTVAAAGGVFVAQRGYFEHFSRRLRRAYDGIERIVLLEDPPVAGALQLAAELTTVTEG